MYVVISFLCMCPLFLQSEEMFAKELALKKDGEVDQRECEKLLMGETNKATEVQIEATNVSFKFKSFVSYCILKTGIEPEEI